MSPLYLAPASWLYRGHPDLFNMRTVTKTFNFNSSNTDGWVAHVSNSRVTVGWFSREFRAVSGVRSQPPVSNIWGCLRTTARQNSPSTENYWEWTGSWEDLGIEAGANVLSASVDYLYRWDAKNSGTHVCAYSHLIFASTDAAAGPAEFYSGSTLVDTFSDRVYCPERTEEDQWNHYPVGAQQHPIQQTPMWGLATGSVVILPTELTASTSMVKFHIRNLMPATPPAYEVDGQIQGQWLRFKNDAITITMVTDQEPLVPTGSLRVPLIMFSD